LKYLKIGKSYTRIIYKILWIRKEIQFTKIDHDKLKKVHNGR
jgi:hypothetical protein